MVYCDRHECKEQDRSAELFRRGNDPLVPGYGRDLGTRFLARFGEDSSHEISSLSAHLFCCGIFLHLLLHFKRNERGSEWLFAVRKIGRAASCRSDHRHTRPSTFFLADGWDQPEGLTG